MNQSVFGSSSVFICLSLRIFVPPRRTRDLRDTGAMLYQLSYEATHWERGQFIEFISSRAVK